MPKTAASLEQLFDRTWRPGHPFRPRLSPLRRWGMFGFLCFLVAIIGAYWYLTDATRVKTMCETYLSQLTGGQVQVRHAALSIFEGLRLDGVTVRVDQNTESDSTIFEVQTVLIKYNPESILNGKLEATQIIAIDPRIHLCEHVDTHQWNYERLASLHRSTTQPGRKLGVLPQIMLRNGHVDFSQIPGHADRPVGSMALDGSLSPGETPGTYEFKLQSRGKSDALGPVVEGTMVNSTGEVTARLSNFEFGPDIKAILPSQPRQWCEEHKLAGRVDIPQFHIKPGINGARSVFTVVTELHNVQLAVSPREWLGKMEQNQIAHLHGAFDLLRVAGLGRRQLDTPELPMGHPEGASFSPAIPDTGHTIPGLIDRLDGMITPQMIQLENVGGDFVFTQDGIEIQHLLGSVEHNPFRISGHIDGYTPNVPATIELVGESIYIPHSPRYAAAMPRIVREIYEAIHPEGTCSVWVKVQRPDPDKKPILSGEMTVLDGQFMFDLFPYPLRGITGTVAFGPDEQRGDRLELKNLRCHGVAGGPNRDKLLMINGVISPINGDAEMIVHITGENIVCEPAIRAALPPEGRDVFKMLDPSGTGVFPTFTANVIADIYRAPGPYKPFKVTVALDLLDAAGAFESFPYFLEHITGRLVVGLDIVPGAPGGGYLTLDKWISKKGDASVVIDGGLEWDPGKPPTPTMTINARNVPIDKQLLAAISPERRAWLERIGIAGKLNVDGKIFHPTASTRPSDVNVELDMAVRDGSLLPQNSTYAMSDVSGKLRLADNRVLFSEFKGKRGEGDLTASGACIWTDNKPQLAVLAGAQNLLMEPALRELLPRDAQAAWDQVTPKGTVDVNLRYGTDSLAATPTTKPSVYEVTLRPRQLSAVFKSLPYALNDLSGAIVVNPDGTTLQNVIGKHRGATISLSGSAASGDRAGWNLQLVGKDVPVDDELRKALPPSLAELMRSMKLTGKVSFDFPKLVYRPGEPPTTPSTRAAAPEPDLDLAGTIWFIDSSMDVGVPIAELNGLLKLDCGIRAGKLAGLKGLAQGETLKIAGRPAKNFSAELYKPETQDAMRIGKIQAQLAGGEMAGQVELAFPEHGASRFAMGLLLHNVDVRQLAGEEEQIKGQLDASLALEGAWNDTSTRRGRGDVKVAGRDMYKIPLVLGLLQITNLSLPISSPFNEATARYSVDGQKVTFETIEMRASNMIMQGSGSLNFDTKKVKMTFTTDNPNWPKLPILSDLIQGAKHELLQFHVNGTIEDPKVSGAVMGTFQTTVDEVLRAGETPAADSVDSPSKHRRK